MECPKSPMWETGDEAWKDWELARVGIELPHGPWSCCARNCMRPGSGAAVAWRPFVTARKAFLSSNFVTV